MFRAKSAFSSFSANDIDAAKSFYGEKLGFTVADDIMGSITVTVAPNRDVFIYPKPDHQPATFTVLHLVVDDVEKAVDELNALGVTTKIYADDELTDMPNDAKGIMRDENNDAQLAWFRDPAGNVIGVVKDR